MKQGKKYVDSVKLIDSTKAYDSSEALDLVCQTAKAKFDETVELHVRLGVDSRHADQQVEAQLYCPTVQVRLFVHWFSLRAKRSRLLSTQVLISLLTMIQLRRLTTVGWTSTL